MPHFIHSMVCSFSNNKAIFIYFTTPFALNAYNSRSDPEDFQSKVEDLDRQKQRERKEREERLAEAHKQMMEKRAQQSKPKVSNLHLWCINWTRHLPAVAFWLYNVTLSIALRVPKLHLVVFFLFFWCEKQDKNKELNSKRRECTYNTLWYVIWFWLLPVIFVRNC